MRKTALFILKKYLLELAMTSTLLASWPLITNTTFLEMRTMIFGSVVAFLLGTLATGYIFFVCVLGTLSVFFSCTFKSKFLVICALSSAYVLIYFALSPKNEITIPIALVIVTANIAYIALTLNSTAAETHPEKIVRLHTK